MTFSEIEKGAYLIVFSRSDLRTLTESRMMTLKLTKAMTAAKEKIAEKKKRKK